jgi:hypothetical protein
MWLVYFGLMSAAGQLVWPLELWAGSSIMASLLAGLLAYLATGPGHSRATVLGDSE